MTYREEFEKETEAKQNEYLDLSSAVSYAIKYADWLINRIEQEKAKRAEDTAKLTAEVERLKKINCESWDICKDKITIIEKKRKEVERLREENKTFKNIIENTLYFAKVNGAPPEHVLKKLLQGKALAGEEENDRR